MPGGENSYLNAWVFHEPVSAAGLRWHSQTSQTCLRSLTRIPSFVTLLCRSQLSKKKKEKKGKHKYLHVIPTEFYLGSLAAYTSRSHSILKSLRWQRSLSAAPLCGQKPPGKRHGTSHTLPRNPPCRLRVLGAAPMSQRKETRSRVYTARHGENPRWQGRHVAFLQAFPAPGAGEGGSPPRGPRSPRFPSSSALPANRGLVSGRLDTGHEPLRRSLTVIFRPHVFFPKPRLAKGSSD